MEDSIVNLNLTQDSAAHSQFYRSYPLHYTGQTRQRQRVSLAGLVSLRLKVSSLEDDLFIFKWKTTNSFGKSKTTIFLVNERLFFL